MPKLASAKKRLRQNITRRLKNIAKKETYRSLKRSIVKALQKGEKTKLSEMLNNFYKAVDKAAKSGAIHFNKASREKSRLLALVKKGAVALIQKRSKAKSSKKTAKAKVQKAARKKGSGRKGK